MGTHVYIFTYTHAHNSGYHDTIKLEAEARKVLMTDRVKKKAIG